MITPALKISSFILFTFLSFFSFSQQSTEKIWVTFEAQADVPSFIEGELRSSNSSIQALIEEFNVINVEQAVPASKVEMLTKVYEVACNCDAEALSKAISNRSTVLTNPVPAPVYELLATPNDYTSEFQVDYALDLIDAQVAWDYSIGDVSTIIGISDGNFYVNHEELETKIDFYDSQNGGTDYYHGTAVAITAAGHTNNGLGKSSIGYNCNLNLTSTGYNQILEMSQQGIRVINVSWASGCNSNAYIQNVIDEIYANGSIVVAAAGNGSTCGGSSNPVFPAACDRVISVTSIGQNDNHERTAGDPSSSHQHHSTVDICAPGYDIAISMAPGSYTFGSGSSFAAPIVSGTIGLMLSLRPCLTFEEVVEILEQSSDDIYTLNPDYVGLLGAGRLNAGRALELTEEINCGGAVISNPTVVDSTIIGLTVGGTTGVLSTNGNGSTPDPVTVIGQEEVDKTPGEVNNVADLENIEVMNAVVYPNPTAGSATLQWQAGESMELTVVDVRGVIVDHQILRSGTDKTEINVEHRGVYFLKISKDDEMIWFGKLIKS